MTAEATETVACPFCAGEIKSAARVCKHCKRMLDGGAAATTAAAPASPAAVLGELRAFVVARGVVRPEQFDALSAQHPGVDAAVMLGHLAAAGYITAVQVESLREGFRQQQESRAMAVLRVAQERGLLTLVHVEQALAGFRGALFQQTIGEYLTAAGLLTVAPATELQRSTTVAGSVVVGAKAWWGRLSKTGRGAVYVLVGLPVVWIVWAAIWLTVGAIRGEADVQADGVMNGFGHGTATFTNRGSRAGSVCGRMVAVCSRGSRSSASFCSGTVAPRETRQVTFTVPGLDRIVSRGGDWRDDCAFDFVNDSRGD